MLMRCNVGDIRKKMSGEIYVITEIYSEMNDDRDEEDYFAHLIFRTGRVEQDVDCRELNNDDLLESHYENWRKSIASDIFQY